MPRTPLAITFINRDYNNELTPFQRGMIGDKALGHKAADIGRALDFSVTTCKTIIKKHSSNITNGESKSRFGRSHKLFNREKRFIIRLARKNPQITYAQLFKETSLTCSKLTCLSSSERLWSDQLDGPKKAAFNRGGG